jgi:hypothetical protein
MRSNKTMLSMAIALAILGPIGAAQAQERMGPDMVQMLKANVIPIVPIPPEMGTAHSYQEELVEGYVRANLVWTGQKGIDWFRPNGYVTGLFNPGGIWGEFNNLWAMPHTKVKIFLKDRFKVVFLQDGSTMEFEFLGPFAPSGLFFQKVDGSERDAMGEPISAVIEPPPVVVSPDDAMTARNGFRHVNAETFAYVQFDFSQYFDSYSFGDYSYGSSHRGK